MTLPGIFKTARKAEQGAGLESPPTTATAGPVIESAGSSRAVPCVKPRRNTAPPEGGFTASFPAETIQTLEAHNGEIGAGLSAEGLRLSQLARPALARAYGHAADRRFESGEWRP